MKTKLILSAAIVAILSGCTSSDNANLEPFPEINESLCRFNVEGEVSQYEVYYTIKTPANTMIYSTAYGDSDAGLLSETKTTRKYIKEIFTKEEEGYSESHAVLGDHSDGLFMFGHSNESNTGLDFTVKFSELLEMKKIGADNFYVESPVTSNFELVGEAAWSEVKNFSIKKITVNKESHPYFTSDSEKELDKSYEIELIACPTA